MEDCNEIFADMLQLKQLAIDHLHLEKPIQIDSLATCKNFFDLASALEQESLGETEEHARVMADAAVLKKARYRLTPSREAGCDLESIRYRLQLLHSPIG